MVTTPAISFGDLVRHYRLAAGLTQQELAERAGLSVHGLQKLERGATHPYRDTAQRLIVALRLETEDKSRLQAAVRPVRRHGSARQPGTAGDPRHNLPSPVSGLVGRDGATRDVLHLLDNTRLLTLTGVGGCGKTRLALEVARSVIDHYAEGVWLVEFGPLSDARLVAARVATVLGIREGAEQPLMTALQGALRRRHILLVLDNCEHLLDACAQLVDGLLRGCPDLRVLATSREPIGIVGEVAWRVPSLELPADYHALTPEEVLASPAVQLFVQRATAAQPRFALTPLNAPAVAQICRRLDGIPLAIELAATRVEAMTVEQILQRLDQRFRLLTGGSRAALPRQQTLAATLDWSYDLLSKPERCLFERLAVFAGGCTLEAAEAVCSDRDLRGEDVLDVLAQLTRKSLVIADETADGGERYSLLETVRDYAWQKLGSRGVEEIAALRDRHAAFYAAWAGDQVPDPGERWSLATPGVGIDVLSQVDAEFDNIGALLNWCRESDRPAPAIRLAIRLLFYWEVRGLYAQARRWLAALLERHEETTRDFGRTALDRGDGTDVITPHERAAAIFIVGNCALRQGDYEEARARHDHAIRVWRELGDDLALAAVLAERGLVAWQLGDSTEAIEYLEESHRLYARCDLSNPVTAAHASNALRNLGLVARSRGDYAHARDYFRESVTVARLYRAGRGYSVARGLCHLGRTAFLQGDVAQANQVFNEALGLMHAERLAGHTLADCLDWLAPIAMVEGRPHDAAVLFGAAQAQWQASGALRYAPERAAHAAELARVQAELSAEVFARAWAAGLAMSREQAINYALDLTRAPELDAMADGTQPTVSLS